jgi:hypothetical protein
MRSEALLLLVGGLATRGLAGCSFTDLDGLGEPGSTAAVSSNAASSAASGAGGDTTSSSSAASGAMGGAGAAGGSAGGGAGGAACGRAPDSTGLIGHWQLDDGAGLDAADASGMDNHALLKSGAAWGATGVLGGAVQLDGTDDVLEVAPSASLDLTGDFTLAAWVRADPISDVPPGRNPRLFQKGVTAGSSVYGLLLESAVEPAVVRVFMTVDGVQEGLNGTTAVTAGAWHHVVGVRDGSVLRVYLDGILDASGAFAVGPLATVAQPLFIGESPGNSDGAVTGAVDELHIYARALSAAEVEALACAPGAR